VRTPIIGRKLRGESERTVGRKKERKRESEKERKKVLAMRLLLSINKKVLNII
jgi:hypothetical protein